MVVLRRVARHHIIVAVVVSVAVIGRGNGVVAVVVCGGGDAVVVGVVCLVVAHVSYIFAQIICPS